ncbi:insulinase family protein [Leisingera sp. ANG-M1]|uniref:insulinase family protein n=1 Tax=Leisingera sp. ANG-M1 TaxID=1577895 RepID=UPI000AE715E0|nr:insulinase family protein [Leisingera sp. ANG-M1]
MQAFKGRFLTALLLVFGLLGAQASRAELVATAEDTKVVYLTPLRNGLSSITLVWPIDRLAQDRVTALKAGLSSVVSGGTSSRSPYKIHEFLGLKGIRQNVSSSGRNLMLTVTAPDEVFPETLVHLENLLLEPEYSSGWYAREVQRITPGLSVRTREPENVLSEVAEFIEFEPDDARNDESGDEFRFGRPSQVILRSGNQEAERRAGKLIKKLPSAEAEWKFSFAKWAEALTGAEKRPFALPPGTIYYEDPETTEMLIQLVKAEEFENERDQIGANLLLNYIGAGQDSEMFRIIRQEMRASYDPGSDFIVMEKNRAIISLSATVEAVRWPEIYEEIRDIYENARSGNIESERLALKHEILNRRYVHNFFTAPAWGALQYLHEYPDGVRGDVRLPVFEALETASLTEVITNSDAHLPPLEDFLLVLIGGGMAPTEALKSKGYCALPENTPLSFCLDMLSNGEN